MQPDLSIESTFSGIIAGIDEAGRGPWAGPVVAAAVVLQPGKLPSGINDSKKLTPAKREVLFELIMASCSVGVGISSVEEIDNLNILQASLLAMRRAAGALSIRPDVALVDGNKPPALECTIKTVVGGDAKSLSIAAASIIAKVTRDRMMKALAEEFPGYGWERNSGYGTAAHQQGLATHGVTPHHRRSYAPIKAYLEAAA